MESLETTPAPRSRVRLITLGAEEAGQRLDKVLTRLLQGLPRSRLYRILRKGEVRLNGQRVGPQTRVAEGDVLRVPPIREPALVDPDAPRPVPNRLRDMLDAAIIYEDERLLVLDKPAGIAVHGGSGLSFGVIEALRAARPADTLELVHRLDRDTSGCLLVARKASTLRTLHALLRESQFEKRYLALLAGKWELGAKRIEAPLRTDLRVGGERTVKVDAGGKSARTDFRPVQFLGRDATLVEVALHTGRTHQIRVHASYAGHPVVGDDKYGDRDFNLAMRVHGLKRLFLHAHSVSFVWPDTGQEFSVNTPLPADLRGALDGLTSAPMRGPSRPRGGVKAAAGPSRARRPRAR